MTIWLQNLLVLAIVALCLAFVLWQMIHTLRTGQGKLGACCARGCHPQQPHAPRIVFLPLESLSRRR